MFSKFLCWAIYASVTEFEAAMGKLVIFAFCCSAHWLQSLVVSHPADSFVKMISDGWWLFYKVGTVCSFV